jgi:hypothetical protein
MNRSTVLTVLKRARAIIDRGWTKHALARRLGESISVVDPRADSFCSIGAIQRAMAEEGVPWMNKQSVLLPLACEIGLRGYSLDPDAVIISNNDNRSTRKEDVLRMFDGVIAKLEPPAPLPPLVILPMPAPAVLDEQVMQELDVILKETNQLERVCV